MFQRLALESWVEVVPYVCFSLIGGAFLLILIRAITMKPAEADRLAAMPLPDDEPYSDTPDTPATTTPTVTNDEQ